MRFLTFLYNDSQNLSCYPTADLALANRFPGKFLFLPDFRYIFSLSHVVCGPNRWVLWVLGIGVLGPVGIGYWNFGTYGYWVLKFWSDRAGEPQTPSRIDTVNS